MNPNHGALVECVSEIIGRTLTSVVFIHDYIQFVFNGPCLSALNLPTFHHADLKLSRNEAGYCDALCSQIEVSVDTVEMSGHHLVIGFASGAQLRISLREPETSCVEMINYFGTNKKWMVV